MSNRSSGNSRELIHLGLRYKGDRNYIHGSDVFNALTEKVDIRAYSGGAYIATLQFARFARNACALSFDEPDEPERTIATGVWVNGDQRCPFWVIETSAAPSGRYPFDEAGLVRRAELRGKSIVLANKTEHSTIEEIIALTKAPNYKLMPDVPGKWVFGKLDLRERLPVSHQGLAIRMRSSIGARFSINLIEIEGRLVGTIQFIVGNP